MRFFFILAALWTTSCTRPAVSSSIDTADMDTSRIRNELREWYYRNVRAFQGKDLATLMALRTDDFQSITPDGVVHDRAEFEKNTRAFLNGIDRWISQSNDLDSLQVSGDSASAVVHQHLVRMALRSDGKVHHVESWVTQRETWRRTRDGWKLFRVDNLRDLRRLIDGRSP
jgi:ketosteroid isomerase-like protein